MQSLPNKKKRTKKVEELNVPQIVKCGGKGRVEILLVPASFACD